MFGTIMIQRKTLTKEANLRYSKLYCGLCHELLEKYGSEGQRTLTYDMTFLGILLSAVYNLPEESDYEKCVTHPLRSHEYVQNKAMSYAADMNIFLAYYQALDDWHDDQNKRALKKSKSLAPFLLEIKEKWPRQTKAIEEGLATLGEMEANNELNPDLPMNCFGKILGEVFVWQEDDYREVLFELGCHLGRFIYLLDAVNDLKADLRKQRYNPLIAQINMDYQAALMSIIAEAADAFESLTIYKDRDIIENVLYAGVWQTYKKESRQGKRNHE
ncbi:MAG TPA: hypothetical protein H9887_07460 [Candidatus Dorea intestinavium]|nr:hypothetical protein [Candidatus Dorea intestinavium]